MLWEDYEGFIYPDVLQVSNVVLLYSSIDILENYNGFYGLSLTWVALSWLSK